MFVGQLTQQTQRHSERREFERRYRSREIDQPALSSEVEDAQHARDVQALSFGRNDAPAVIHQQEISMELKGRAMAAAYEFRRKE
jgi:hypothetical protein